MSDNLNPINDQPAQGSGTSSDPASGQNRYPTPPGMVGQTSDPQGSIQITPAESNTAGTQPHHTIVDDSRDIPSMNKSIPSTSGTYNILETWFDKDMVDEMHSRWNAIQVQFVDSPCASVEQGEALVAEILERLSQILANQQNNLNQQWLSRDDITTEELRITLQNYRSFLNHLLKL